MGHGLVAWPTRNAPTTRAWSENLSSADLPNLAWTLALARPRGATHCAEAGSGGRLVGIDLSPNMLAQAAALQIYDRLVEAEATRGLASLSAASAPS